MGREILRTRRFHVASGYSARYGASHPVDLVRRAAERGIGTLALTDRDTVAGAVRFAKAAAASGIRPIFGISVAVEPAAPPKPGTVSRARTPDRGGAHVVEPALRVTLLARHAAGWARLCRLVSAAHAGAEGGVPVVTWEVLSKYAGDGLIVLLGPSSEPVRALSAGRPDLAAKLVAPWCEVAGAGLRLETVWWGLSGTGPGSLRLAARTVGLADELGVRAVLTNAVRYADPGRHRIADVLDAARRLRPIDRRRLDCGERWLKGPAAMAEAAERIAEASGAGPGRAGVLLAETLETAEQCVIDPVADLGMGHPHFPEPAVVGAQPSPGGAMELLRRRCSDGMFARGLDRDRRAVGQLEYELGVIGQLRFEPYFLAVAQVVADVRAMGIRVAARGCGAGSMVNHALFIATANPLDHNLLFECFLSVRRASMPDIDIDVESARRLEVYDRIIERFGLERVAVTGMPETYRARHALRDTGLALGLAPHPIWFLQQKGLLQPEPADPDDLHRAAIAALAGELPETIATEVRCWVTVLRGEGRLEHRARPFIAIRSNVRTLMPLLREWAIRAETLREIGKQDIEDALKGRSAGQARQVLHSARSLFRALRQERMIFRDPTRGVSLPTNLALPRMLPSDRLVGLLDREPGAMARLGIALTAIHALKSHQSALIILSDLNLASGQLTVGDGYLKRTIFLEDLTMDLVAAWLRTRHGSWPATLNPHLLITTQTARHIARPPISEFARRSIFRRTGTTAEALRQDRILHEAHQTADPVHLMKLFGISATTAVRYVYTAHPEKTGRTGRGTR